MLAATTAVPGLLSVAAWLAAACWVPLPGGSPQLGPEIVLRGTVVDAEAKPVAGAEVFFWVLTDVTLARPVPPVKTDGAGRFQISVPRPLKEEPLCGVYAFSPRHRVGAVGPFTLVAGMESLRVELPPPSKFRVRVLDPQGAAVAGATVTVHSSAISEPAGLASRRTVTTDAQGMAALPFVGADEVGVLAITSADYGVQNCSRMGPEAEEWTVRLRRVGRVRGRVVADRPEAVRGVTVQLRSDGSSLLPEGMEIAGSAEVTTNDAGEFAVPAIAAGQLSVEIPRGEKPAYLAETIPSGQVAVGETTEITVRLFPTVRVQGLVREVGTGKPLTQIRLEATVYEEHAIFPYPEADDLVTDDAGRFELVMLPRPLLMRINNRWEDGWILWSGAWIEVPAGVEDFTVPPIEVLVLEGRVIDERGIGGADVSIYVRQTGEDPSPQQSQQKAVVTDAKGRYRIGVSPEHQLALAANALGHFGGELPWTDAGKFRDGKLPDLVLKGKPAPVLPDRVLQGRVLDRQGGPVAGATVFAIARPRKVLASLAIPEGKTDAQGRFKLEDMAERDELVFVEKEGFRFQGQWVSRDTKKLDVVLIRSTEPPARRLKTLPPPGSRAERMNLGRRLMNLKPEEFDPLSTIGPAATQSPGMKLFEKASRLLGGEPITQRQRDEAAWEDASRLIERCDALPRAAHDERERLLRQALGKERALENPGGRVILFGRIAERLLDLGSTEEATALFSEARQLAQGPARRASSEVATDFAPRLARIDVGAAMGLLEPVQSMEQVEVLEKIAILVARTKPAEAERILESVKAEQTWGADPTRVCARMAAADLPRARKLAEKIEERSSRLWALGMMANGLGPAEREAARALVREAIEGLEAEEKVTEEAGWAAAGGAEKVASLLPVAERVDPDRLDEYFWRVVALRRPPRDEDLEEQEPEEFASEAYNGQHRDAILAAVLARYDRAAAEKLFVSAWERIPPRHRAVLGGATATVDPKRAAQALSEAGVGIDRNHARMVVGGMLALEDRRYWHQVVCLSTGLESFEAEDLEAIDHAFPCVNQFGIPTMLPP